MIARWRLPSPEVVIVTATLTSAFNALVALGIVHLSSAHLAVVNIGLASVLGLAARRLVPAQPSGAGPAGCPTQQRERGST